MNITVGGADVTIQTGGVAMNMVTRRGGNKISLGGRYYMGSPIFKLQDEHMFGDYRLPFFYNLTLRLEKMLRVGDTGKIYVMADIFNALNSSVLNRRDQRDWGNYYIYSDPSNNYFRSNTNFYEANEVLNPRVIRLGIRFTF